MPSRPPVLGRIVDIGAERTFRLEARNDFLTPQGNAYKWQEVRAGLSRTVAGAAGMAVLPVRYTWQTVDSRIGAAASAHAPRTWTFARGQGFTTAVPRRPADGSRVEARRLWSSDALDVSYPDLPRLPAVDLLLMLSWDVLMFETLCTELASSPDLVVGSKVHLSGVSGTSADLRFSHPSTDGMFRNGRMYATKLGYGNFAGHLTAVFSFECLDCDLTTRLGPVTQQGRSSYLGTLHIDARTSDLVGGEFLEMIVSTVTGADGRQAATYKRRQVRLSSLDPDTDGPSGRVRTAAGHADRLVRRARANLGSLGQLPAHLAPLADEGFRGAVGCDRATAIGWLTDLRRRLHAWADGDPTAAAAVSAGLSTHGRRLQGLRLYCQTAGQTAEQLGLVTGGAREAMRQGLAALDADAAELATLLSDVQAGVDRM